MKRLKLLRKFLAWLNSYVWRKSWRINKRYVLIIEFITLGFSDPNYSYKSFSFLPCIDYQERWFIWLGSKRKDFDYIVISLCWLVFHLEITYQKNN